MKRSLLFCMCICSVTLVAQQPGQRFPNRPRIFPRNQERQDQVDQSEGRQGQQLLQDVMEMQQIDSNGDGVKSEQEIHEAVQRFLDQSRERNPQRFKRVMQRFDTDKDQQISRSEAVAIYKEVEGRLPKNRSGEVSRAGEPGNAMSPEPPNIDLNRDGVVSEQEIHTAIRAHLDGERVRNPQHYNMLMQQFDTDKDQNIDVKEAMAIHQEHEKRMRENHQGGFPPEARQVTDNGLLKGIKIEGLNIGSGL